MKVYIVIHDFYSHDMIQDQGGNPKIVAVRSTKSAAMNLVRPNMDDEVFEIIVDDPRIGVKKRVGGSY